MDIENQRSYIRGLAEKLRVIADSDDTADIIKRWADVNALRKPDRAPVFCRPSDAWNELLPEDSLVCADRTLRRIEAGFKRTIIKHEIGDDTVVYPYYPVEAVFDVEPANVYGLGMSRTDARVRGGAWAYEPELKDERDFFKLVIPRYTYNKTKTDERTAFIHELFGDILPPKICAAPVEYATICSPAAGLRGLTQMMTDAADNPEFLHRLMAYLRDAALATMDQKLAAGVLTPNTIGEMYMSGELDPAPGEPITYKNCFGVGNSQEFDQISPAMWEEFLLAYQKPIYARFGLAAYGCCENLTKKIDGIMTIPNLRVFVSSAWTDLDTVVDKTGGKYTVMWRQKATDVCFADDAADLIENLKKGCERLKGCCYQIVLRELQTLNGNLNRLHEWAYLAKEAACG